MSESYAIVRIEKYSSTSAIGRIERHNERKKEVYKSNPDIDTGRSCLNYHLITPAKRYNVLIENRIREANIKRLRKDSIRLQDAIVTASPDWINCMPLDEQKEYFRYALDFFTARYGKENFISAVVHMDEKTPHLHFSFVPITKDGRLSSKEVIGGPVGMSRLQNEFYDYMKQRYPDLDRGVPKRLSNREHLPTSTFKEVAELTGDLQGILDSVGKMHVLNMEVQKLDVLKRVNEFGQKVAEIQSAVNSNENYINESRQNNADLAGIVLDLKDHNAELDKKVDSLKVENSRLRKSGKEMKLELDYLNQYEELYEKLLEKIRQIPKEKRIELGLEKSDIGRNER